MGRRGMYDTHVLPRLKDISQWYLTQTEQQIAKRLGIAPITFEKYKSAHAELREALSRGREDLADELKLTLKKKALGFYYTEKKTVTKTINGIEQILIEEYEKYSPPDVGAIHLLLKNIDDEWRNDDRATVDLKKQKLELDAKKAEADEW